MSAAARGERQLMRQRGAGLRDVSNVNFGLNFDTQNGRDERLLMRQRGAGNRQMNDVDFSLRFPSRRQSRASVSRTPFPERRKSSRLSKTPSSGVDGENTTRTAGRGSEQRKPAGSFSQPALLGSLAAKRRKTNDGTIHSMSTRQRNSSGANFAILEEDQSDEVIRSNAASPHPKSPLFFADDNEKENEVATSGDVSLREIENKSTHKRSGLLPKKRTKKSSGFPEPPVEPAIETQDLVKAQVSSHISELEDNDEQSILANGTLGQKESKRQSMQLPIKKRKKRKSVVLGRKKRRSSGETSTISTTTERSNTEVEPVSVDIEHNSPDPSLPTKSVEAASPPRTAHSDGTEHGRLDKFARLRRNRRSRLSISATPEPQQQDNEDEDESYVDEEHTPDPTTPAVKQRPRPKRSSSGANPGTRKRTADKSSASSFPILVHRMSNTHMLPTIHEGEEPTNNTGNAELLENDIFKDRSMPNAVDVLAQICRETIDTAIEQLGNQTASNQNRVQLRKKRSALEAFGNELDQRLFDMSEAVEYRLTLASRLRKSNREKSDLQARWFEIRRQRDELALRADTIRRRNWEHEEEHKSKWEVSKMAHNIELQLERESPTIGLEFMLRNVAGVVSNAQSGPGLLDRLRGFNTQLERVATVLEGRKSQ